MQENDLLRKEYEQQVSEYNAYQNQIKEQNEDKAAYETALRHFNKGYGAYYLKFGDNPKIKDYIKSFLSAGYEPTDTMLALERYKQAREPEYVSVTTTEIPQEKKSVYSQTIVKKNITEKPKIIKALIASRERKTIPATSETYIKAYNQIMEKAIKYPPLKYIADIERQRIEKKNRINGEQMNSQKFNIDNKYQKIINSGSGSFTAAVDVGQGQMQDYIFTYSKGKITSSSPTGKTQSIGNKTPFISINTSQDVFSKQPSSSPYTKESFLSRINKALSGGSITQKYFELFGVKFYKKGEIEYKQKEISQIIEKTQKAETPEKQEEYITELKKRGVSVYPTLTEEGKVYYINAEIATKRASDITQNVIDFTDSLFKFGIFAPYLKTGTEQIGEAKVKYKEIKRIEAMQKKAQVDLIKKYGAGEDYRGLSISKSIKRGKYEIGTGTIQSKIMSKYLRDISGDKSKIVLFKTAKKGTTKELSLIARRGKVRNITYTYGRVSGRSVYGRSFIFKRFSKLKLDKFILEKITGVKATKYKLLSKKGMPVYRIEQRLLINNIKKYPISTRDILLKMNKKVKIPKSYLIKSSFKKAGIAGKLGVSLQKVKIKDLNAIIDIKTGKLIPKTRIIQRINIQRGSETAIKNVDDYQNKITNMFKDAGKIGGEGKIQKKPLLINLNNKLKQNDIKKIINAPSNTSIKNINKSINIKSVQLTQYTPDTSFSLKIPKISLKEKILAASIQKAGLIDLSKSRQRSMTKIALKIKTSDKIKEKTRQKQEQKQRMQQKQMLKNIGLSSSLSIPIIKLPEINITTPPPIKPPKYAIKDLLFNFNFGGKGRKKFKIKKQKTAIYGEMPDFTSRILGLPRETIKISQAKEKIRQIKSGFELRRGIKLAL